MSTARVLVIGSVNIDRSLRVPHLPGPGETIGAVSLHIGLGGKGANQAIAAARAGANTWLIACIGDDPAGHQALTELRRDAVDTSGVTIDPAAPTGLAVVIVDADGENSIVVASGANAALRLPILDVQPAVVLAQMEIPIGTLGEALRRFSASVRIVNAAPFSPGVISVLEDIDVLVVNETEYAQLGEATGRGAAKERPPSTVVVTRGSAGVDIIRDSKVTHVPAATASEVIDTTAAGDTFCGYLAAGLAANDDLEMAARQAVRAAAICVSRQGAVASIPHAHEVA